MNYKGIIFDFFGVISSEVSPFWLQKHFPQDQVADFEEKYISPVNRGDISYEQLIDQLAQAANLSPENVRKEWSDLVVVNEKAVSFIKEMQGDYKIGLLSDAPAEFLRTILHEYGLENLFDEIVISSEVKITKRDTAIYSLMLERLGLAGSEVVFIDDKLSNIKLAEQLGIKGHVYDSTKDLNQLIE